MEPIMLSILGGALAAGLAMCGSAIGCAISGQAGAGVVSEDPGKFGRLLLLQALPGTQGIYGLVAMFLIVNRMLALMDVNALGIIHGWQLIFAALPVALTGLISAIYQGKVCASGSAMVAKRPAEVGKGMIFAVVVETYAVLGLLATILLLQRVGMDVLAQ